MEAIDTAHATWRKSEPSNGSGHCVEVADLSGGVGVRDSKNVMGGVLTFPPTQWSAFIAGVKHGTFLLVATSTGSAFLLAP